MPRASQLLEGIAYLNTQHHVIHRDIKPSNMLLSSNGELRISDLGLVSNLMNSMENAVSFVGTVLYMSVRCCFVFVLLCVHCLSGCFVCHCLVPCLTVCCICLSVCSPSASRVRRIRSPATCGASACRCSSAQRERTHTHTHTHRS